jgi:hypothetical protein
MYLAVPDPEEVAAACVSDPTTGNRHRPEPTEGRMGEKSIDVKSNLRFLAARRGLEPE